MAMTVEDAWKLFDEAEEGAKTALAESRKEAQAYASECYEALGEAMRRERVLAEDDGAYLEAAKWSAVRIRKVQSVGVYDTRKGLEFLREVGIPQTEDAMPILVVHFLGDDDDEWCAFTARALRENVGDVTALAGLRKYFNRVLTEGE